MTRRRRSHFHVVLSRWLRWLRIVLDVDASRRSRASKKAWQTRKRNSEDSRAAEDLARMEAARVFGSDPTP